MYNNTTNTKMLTTCESFTGGIVGYISKDGSINCCYNTGNISADTGSYHCYGYAGGVIGNGDDADVSDSYNIGNVCTMTSNSNDSYSSVDNSCIRSGGIAGYINKSSINNCYNAGDISSINSIKNDDYYCHAGAILGDEGYLGYVLTNCYYLETIDITAPNINNEGTSVSELDMMSKEFYNALNVNGVWHYIDGEYPKLIDREILSNIEESTELSIQNTIKKFKITTDILEINDVKGGSITGEDDEPYETVTVYESNKSEIEMKPEVGYGISNITVNGETIDYTIREDGSYRILAGYFDNVQEDKHVVVTFSPLEQILVINKVDEDNETIPLEGAKFIIDQDQRHEITDEIGELTENGPVYAVPNTEISVTDALREMQKNGEFYFEKDGDSYKSNNKGKSSKVANSYVEIDLSSKNGYYLVVVNAQVSSESSYDWGYATITSTVDAPNYDNSNGRFIYISGNSESVTVPTDYTSNALIGGNKYYLHFGYRKDSGGNTGDDEFKINSINVYEASDIASYSFNEYGGEYVSNNQNKDNTVANSYIPINLIGKEGKYDLKINAEISSQSYSDYGYVTVTEDTIAPSYNNTTNRMFLISGTQSAKTYTKVLTAGKMYYVHLGYYKNASMSSGTDTFTINSVELSLNKDDYYFEEHITNSQGEIRVAVPAGKYTITEIEAPTGYTLNDNPAIADVGIGYDNTVTITNKHKTDVIVHHYLKNNDGTLTDKKVAEDDILKGDIGSKYETSPKTDLVNLELEKNEDGTYKIPNDAIGNFEEDTIEVTYYYVLKPIELTINHYIDGTTKPLVDEKTEDFDPSITFNEDNTYNITAEGTYDVSENEDYKGLLREYNLVRVESDATEQLSEEDNLTFTENAELKYFYQLKEHNITTEVKEHTEERTNPTTQLKEAQLVKGGKITGEESNPFEIVDHGGNSEESVIVESEDGYTVSKITLVNIYSDESQLETVIYGEGKSNDAEITYEEREDGTIVLGKFSNVTADKHIIVEFAPIPGTVKVHHYMIESKDESDETQIKRPKLTSGEYARDEVKNDLVGERYATKQLDDLATMYKLVEVDGDTSGIYTEDAIDVYYYYDFESYDYTVHYFYDYEEDIKQMENGTAKYGQIISDYEDKPTKSDDSKEYKFNKVDPANEDVPNKANLQITEAEDKNEINVYYGTEFNITTEVITHDEKYRNGNITNNVKGGTIDGEGSESYETVFKRDSNTKSITITPEENYTVARITVKDGKDATEGTDIDFKENTNGTVTIDAGYFTDMQSDKHIQVEFRRKTSVTIKYLEELTEEEVAEQDKINGYEGKIYEASRKAITYYEPSILGVRYENSSEQFNEETDNVMYADEYTIVYWYRRIQSGLIVRHIEINEKDKKDGLTMQSGREMDTKLYTGGVNLGEVTSRNTYENYISVDGPKSDNPNITVADKDEDNVTATYVENELVEVWYYYERQYDLTTEVKAHKETVEGVEKDVKGGAISGENDTPYEKVNKLGSNERKIEITPDYGYQVKQVTINEKEINLSDLKKDGRNLVIEKGYIKDVDDDMNIVVEFERRPAKVIVEYKDVDTKEDIITSKEVSGLVNDTYSETRPDLEYYIPAEPNPSNCEGKMTEEDIVVTYWYIRQFKITTDIIEHIEKDESGNIVNKKGGSITGEDSVAYETVTRGQNSTLSIVIGPDDGYRIKEIRINGNAMDYMNDDEIIKLDGNGIELPIAYFTNVQEDKHITVEFEKTPTMVEVQYLEDGTDIPVSEPKWVYGHVYDSYKVGPKDLEYYDLVRDKNPENSEGTMTEDKIVVKYYYRRLLFNFKLEKEVWKVYLNGKYDEESIEMINRKLAKVEVKYSDINQTNLEIAYKIKVTNTEKIAGTATIQELLPDGLTFVAELSDLNWNLIDGKCVLVTDEIQPGETMEYIITLRWNPDALNSGDKVNFAKITGTNNIPNFDETTLMDNEDNAVVRIKLNRSLKDIIDNIKDGKNSELINDVITNVKTGDSVIIPLAILVVAGAVIIVTVAIKCRKGKK